MFHRSLEEEEGYRIGEGRDELNYYWKREEREREKERERERGGKEVMKVEGAVAAAASDWWDCMRKKKERRN